MGVGASGETSTCVIVALITGRLRITHLALPSYQCNNGTNQIPRPGDNVFHRRYLTRTRVYLYNNYGQGKANHGANALPSVYVGIVGLVEVGSGMEEQW